MQTENPLATTFTSFSYRENYTFPNESYHYDDEPPIHPFCNLDWDKLIDSAPDYKLCIQILLPIMCSISIVSIILTVHVLSRKTMSTSTNSYLISLATSDLVVVLCLSLKCLETKLSREVHYYYYVIVTCTNILMSVCLMASVWLTVMLAIERYIAICHPLRAMSICTVVRARAIIILIFILSTLSRIPEVFKYKLDYFTDPCLNKEVPFMNVPELATNKLYRDATSWTECVLLVFFPFSLLFLLNACLIREIHRSTKYLRCHLATDSNVQSIITGEEIKITLMLISVVVVFFVCCAPYAILSITKRLRQDELFDHYHVLSYVTILLVVLRSSFNFVLYCWFSEKFRNSFKKTYCNTKCLFARAPKWVRNQSDQIHSNSNRKISYFNTKETTC